MKTCGILLIVIVENDADTRVVRVQNLQIYYFSY